MSQRAAPGQQATGRSRSARVLERFAADANSVLERQLCTAAVFVLAQLMLLVPSVAVTHTGPYAGAWILMIMATVAAFVLRAPAVPPRASMLIPLVDILAVGLLRAGTGGAASVFTIMLVLPVLSLGVEPGRLPLLLGGPVTLFAMVLPLAFDPEALDNGQWVRIVFVPIILGLTCLSANELTRRLRSRVRAVQRLRKEQEELLADAQAHANTLAAASEWQRESTRQLASVIDAVTEQSIIATNQSGRVEVFNAGAQRMLRVAAHDAIGRPITDFHLPEELAVESDGTALSPFAALVAGAMTGTPQVRDWTYVPRTGSQIRVQLAITARRDAARQVDGFLFVATDVTSDREHARLKDEFVNLISHELRTPLSSILGYLELVADDEDNPLSVEQHRYLTVIDRNANRLLRLVSDLLFTAQVESGKFQLDEQRVDLHRILSACLETALPVADRRDVTLKLSACDEAVIVWGDPIRLGQAVDNLIANAVKFTPAGGRVAVTLGSVDHPDAQALVSVSDTGIGIPADELDRLFSRFFRASTATSNAIPGVGLGLTITRAIVGAHRGSIGVASTRDQGTTFTVRLPLAAEQPSVLAGVTGSASRPRVRRSQLSGTQVVENSGR